MNGILVVDKPAGWTSFDVIAKLRGILATRRIGHSGTLDPMATGVLPVFVGPAARAVDLQSDHTKEYVAGVRFGLATDTGDITGRTIATSDKTVSRQALLAVLPRFVGVQQQLPPMYSAVKVDGQPLYKAARRGEEVARTPRTITVHQLQLLEEYPPALLPPNGGQNGQRMASCLAEGQEKNKNSQNEFLLRILCSKGSYVRVLLQDIGAALGVPATMCSLRRTRSGAYTLAQAHTLAAIQAAKDDGTLSGLLAGVDTVFAALPALTVDAATEARLKNGSLSRTAHPNARLRVYSADGSFLGLATATDGQLQVEKLFIERK